MRPVALSIVVALLGVSSPGNTHAQYARERSDVRYALSGATIVLRRHYHMDDDCTSGPIPRLQVVEAPRLGERVTRVSARNPLQSTRPDRIACNRVRVRTLEVRYRATRGKRGEDRVAYDLYRHDSSVWREEFVIHVR